MAASIEVVDVNETSYSLFETSGAYAASQYGAIFYTHDPSSQIVETGASYNDTVQELCRSLVQNSTYNTEEECLAFGYSGYLIQVGYKLGRFFAILATASNIVLTLSLFFLNKTVQFHSLSCFAYIPGTCDRRSFARRP